jgi:hypothetical protein
MCQITSAITKGKLFSVAEYDTTDAFTGCDSNTVSILGLYTMLGEWSASKSAHFTQGKEFPIPPRMKSVNHRYCHGVLGFSALAVFQIHIILSVVCHVCNSFNAHRMRHEICMS